MGRLTPAVLGLLIANIALFVITLIAENMRWPINETLALWFPKNGHFAIWQPVTYMFMHGGPSHIFFNMFALVSFGLPLEQLWGTRRFLEFFLFCGLGAGLVQLGVQWFEFTSHYQRLVASGMSAGGIDAFLKTNVLPPSSMGTLRELVLVFHSHTVGASGAIYGVLVAFGLTYPNAKLALVFAPVPIAAKYFIPALVALDLLSGVTGFSLFGGGIAHFAHVGGALIGLCMMWFWRVRMRRRAVCHEFQVSVDD